MLVTACQSLAGPEVETYIIRGTVVGVSVLEENAPSINRRLGTSIPQMIKIKIDTTYPDLPENPETIIAHYMAPTQRVVTGKKDTMVIVGEKGEFFLVEFAEPIQVNCFETAYENLEDFYDDDEANIGTVLGRSHCYASDR